MQTLLLPAGRSGISPTAAAASHLRRVPSLNIGTNVSFLSSNSVPSLKTLQSSSLANRGSKHCFPILASSQIPPTFTSQNDESEKAKLAQVTSPTTFYCTAGGIAASFISVFWSFGYIRLSEKLRKTASDPSKAPPRADVVKSLKNGIGVNLVGMGAAILGMQATVGLLVAKALTTSANPYYQGITPGYSPVLALDVFLVQASANTILSHFLGLLFSLELLRSVTLPPSESIPVPRVA
ncbi:protein TIC 21 [Citrus sinensis]|uniref:Protein TIC 21 n=1 Tax=Citrus sinensis TaxID=2711 RepID=A0ACB8IE34_CITSI|nr:protein TIC 21 [Citrus sinensis]